MCAHTSKESLKTETMTATSRLWVAHREIMKLGYFTSKIRVFPKHLNGIDQSAKTSKRTASAELLFLLFIIYRHSPLRIK